MLADTRVTFGQFGASGALEHAQRGAFQRFRNRLAMGRACDAAVDDILGHADGGVAMTVQILVPVPNVFTGVRMVEVEEVEDGGPISRFNNHRSHLHVTVQGAQVAGRERVAEFGSQQAFLDALAAAFASLLMLAVFGGGGERVAMALTCPCGTRSRSPRHCGASLPRGLEPVRLVEPFGERAAGVSVMGGVLTHTM